MRVEDKTVKIHDVVLYFKTFIVMEGGGRAEIRGERGQQQINILGDFFHREDVFTPDERFL